MNVRFGISADLHTEFIHDAAERMNIFLEECKSAECDFCIQLGDFCPPGEPNEKHKLKILELISQAPFPFYHVLGNHDLDENEKTGVLSFLGEKSAYYSFDSGGVHFIVLDACYYRDKENHHSYAYGNYKSAEVAEYTSVLPSDELDWLEKDLINAKYPSVLFSHQSLVESRTGIGNAQKLREILKKAPHGVIFAACGHEHVDRIEEKDGIYYFCVNSMSYYWAGSKFTHTTYGNEIESRYPKLRSVFPYREPIYAIVDIDDNRIEIMGKQSEIIGKSPADLQFCKPGLVDTITAGIKNKTIVLQLK